MSINSAMQTGVTGLAANSQALTTISNNIANVNTTGYKRGITDFQDIITGSTTSASNNSGGVNAVTRQTITQTGELAATNSSLDLGIDGQGFFVVSGTSAAVTTANSVKFTRDGSFSTDKQGFLQNAAGLYLQGWAVNPDGSVSSDSSDLTRLSSINISNIGGTAAATTQVAINANLQSSQPTTTFAAGTYDPTSPTESMSVYNISASPPVGTKPDFEISIPVSDSKGGQQTLTMSLLKSGANTWNYEIWSPNIADTNGNTIATGGTGQVATGKLVFTSSGELDPANSTSDNLSTSPPGVGAAGSFSPNLVIGDSTAASGVHWAPALGVAGQTVALSLSNSKSGLTQYDSDSSTQSVTSNGTAFGNLSKITIGNDGMVTAVFDNGVTRNIAQVALATFINANGLEPVSGNAYTVSRDSGTFSLRVPGFGGTGSITPNSLESSTVDLSQEFTGLITTQRAYSAASKIITTADQMLQELLSIKQ
ncbi:MAG: flagellar hook-basal body complex protein [Asticcacaulis sp.]